MKRKIKDNVKSRHRDAAISLSLSPPPISLSRKCHPLFGVCAWECWLDSGCAWCKFAVMVVIPKLLLNGAVAQWQYAIGAERVNCRDT